MRELADDPEQRRRCVVSAERLHVGAGLLQSVERNVDAVERAIVLGAVLQVVDHLQRRTQCVVGGPGGAALAMDIEHEAADGHGGIGAVADQVVPITIAQLGHVHAERGEQILRMAGRERARRKLLAQRNAHRIGIALAEEARFQPLDQIELLLRRKRRVIGDVVGRAHELVESEDGAPVTGMNEPRCHREVLVPMALARARVCGSDHCGSDILACTRPFQLPPRPCIYWYAESRV